MVLLFFFPLSFQCIYLQHPPLVTLPLRKNTGVMGSMICSMPDEFVTVFWEKKGKHDSENGSHMPSNHLLESADTRQLCSTKEKKIKMHRN